MDDHGDTGPIFSELRRKSRNAWLNAVALAQRQRDPFTPGLRVGCHWRLASNRRRPTDSGDPLANSDEGLGNGGS